MGREVFLEMARSSKFYNDPFLSLHLAAIKGRLEAATSLPYPVKLTIIESQTPNAFAMIGGYVYVTTALLELCDREEEVAGVLSHEFAHLSRRHIAKRSEKDKVLSAGMIAALLAGMLLKSPAGPPLQGELRNPHGPVYQGKPGKPGSGSLPSGKPA